ncbi:hypothetical protein V7S43_006984 [Phytophthora oleae]|uniref:Myb-like domain-containing protein n=1 Tax=Phytophthora oleae TaxID=2107226 RepID=A0ABD3FNU8_9STRA
MARDEGAAATPAPVGSKRRSSISSVASSGHRRSSVSSVTSSGRKRKEQSLVDVAASLGHRTPERSQANDDGVSMHSRQLNFGDVDGDVDDEQGEEVDVGSAESNQEIDEPEEEEGVLANQNEPDPAAIPARRKRGGRRRDTVFWTVEEEEFLRQGVKKFGVGNWKKILIDGQGVFFSHRTNVDLKDKWKNLTRTAPQKRRRNLHQDALENEGSDEAQSRRPSPPREETSEISSPESVAARPRRRVAVIATLKIGTDQTFPEVRLLYFCAVTFGMTSTVLTLQLVEVNVNLNACKDVAALIEHLRSSLLSNAGDTDVQVIGLKTRELFNDEEHLSRCIETNGVEFYLVYEENSKEFV